MSVQLAGVRLALGDFALAVDACFEAPVTALFGPSGAGKTLLLEILAGLRQPQAGRVVVGGAVLTDRGAGVAVAAEARAVGYVPQEVALFPHLSVQRNLLYGYKVGERRPAGLSYEHVAGVLEIGGLAERSIATLSGGERQRVALGRALLASPQLLLLDEPLTGLDETLKERLLPYLKRVRDEFSIPMVYVSHSPNEVVALADEVVVLVGGRVERQGAPDEVFELAATPSYVLRVAGKMDHRR